jgi:hypothetical protein
MILRHFNEEPEGDLTQNLQKPTYQTLTALGAERDQLTLIAPLFVYARPLIAQLDELRDHDNPDDVWEIASRQDFALVRKWVVDASTDEVDQLMDNYPGIVGTPVQSKPALKSDWIPTPADDPEWWATVEDMRLSMQRRGLH